jgi:ABC-type transport system substrate-binding protein/two-component sensor histidine kinase
VSHKHLELAVFSVDPPTLDMLHGLDPESFLIVTALADPLVYVDAAGAVQPALAVSWSQLSPVTWRFIIREGVQFPDGTTMTADDVVATFAEHLDPANPTVLGRSAFSMIKACRKIGAYEVEIETVAPDNMLLRRLCFSQIYSRALLAAGGREAISASPSACGPYELERWTRGVEIVLRRNPTHWAGRGAIETIRIPILRQKNWVAALREGRIDVALGIDVHDKVRLDGSPGIETFSSDAAISHFFLLKHRGPLANLRIRQALNHAVHRQLIVDIAEHGHGRPQRSIATPETFGYADDIEPYVYNPDLARRILAEEGYADGFTLRGVVSETSTAVYQTVKELLSRVGVRIEAEIKPRADWMDVVRGPKLRGEGDYEGDFALFVLDNPLLHSAFHQFVFLFSHGDWSFLKDPDYDRRFFEAATVTGPEAEAALQALERHVAENAMILFTAQAGVHAAARTGIRFPLPKSGHFDTAFWWNLDSTAEATVRPATAAATTEPRRETSEPEVAALLSATNHLGTLYLTPGTTFQTVQAARVWENLDATQQRWESQLKPMIHELVSQVETKTHLANVLDSTERVAIYGIGDDGRLLFVNEGYRQMIGDGVSPLDVMGPLWAEIQRHVKERGVWSGPINVKQDGVARTGELYLTATRARDPQQVAIGYTLVLSDFSGEEERIRNGAIRAILDNVPYGLFRCGQDGSVLPGYSAACHEILPGARARSVEGISFVDLLGASKGDAEHLLMVYDQLWMDVLPEEVGIDQFPRRIDVAGKALGLAPAPLRDESGAITAVLFSVFDESDRVAAERNQDHLRGIVNVLKHRDPFSSFVNEVVGTSQGLIESYVAGDAEWQTASRRFVHTCKGVFGQFGLFAIAKHLHGLEDAERFDVNTLEDVRRSLREMLAEHRDLWRLTFDDCAPEFAVRTASFDSLEEAIAAAPTLEAAREVVRSWTDQHQRKSVGELVGPMASSCERQAERQGKQVRFVLGGGAVTLPAREWPLVGALTHAVRNAVDHGIETTEERGEKSACGEVRLDFEEHELTISCRISDDGRGVDTQILVAKAKRQGLLTEEQAAALTPDSALALVFAEGLSSAGAVTETAGRGVGMSAVKSAVEDLGGTLDIASKPGRGTVIELRWPRASRRVA